MCSGIIKVMSGVQKTPPSRQTPFHSTSGSLGAFVGRKTLKVLVFKPVLVTDLGFFAELLDAVEEVLPALVEQQVRVYVLADKCKTSHVETFNDKMRRASSEPVPKALRSGVTLANTAVYIYTSGTTGGGTCRSVHPVSSSTSGPGIVFISFSAFAGLPKAAAVSHAKVWALSSLLSLIGITSKDVVYTTLPLYHSAGFLCCTSAIERGSLVLDQTSNHLLIMVLLNVKRSLLCRVQG